MFSCIPADAPASADHSRCRCHTPELLSVSRRLDTALSRRGFLAGLLATAAASALPRRAEAAGAVRPIVFSNLRLFDGSSPSLRDGLSVLVRGASIESVAAGNPTPPEGAIRIDCGGRTVMPGLIDAHWHTLFAALPLPRLLDSDPAYIALVAAAEAERTLMRGFTTVRDLGGPVFSFKQAIDQGIVPGPRIYPSGAMITTTGGHGDLRPLGDLPRRPGGPLSAVELSGGAAIADNADELQIRVREQFMQGASQIKLVGGGGVSSPRSPLDMSTFSEAELGAAVAIAGDWNSYVTVHAYAPHTVQRAIRAGAACIEHAHLMDEPTAALMAEKGVWLSIQPFLSEADSAPLAGPSRERMLQVFAATGTAYRLARAHGIRTAFGSDLLFSAELTPRQGTMLTHLANWYANAEILTMATRDNAALLALSGPRNPYPGLLGVVENGALADLLVVDGNPLDDITLLADPERRLSLIMKDGAIHKNRLGQS